MYVFPCRACGVCTRVASGSADTASIDYLVGEHSPFAGNYKCCKCDSPVHIHKEKATAGSDLLTGLSFVDLTPQEFFQAQHGIGVPAERVVTKEAVVSLLTQNKVVDVVVTVEQGDVAVHELRLSNGYRLYLASTMAGPTVYRIRPPHNRSEHVATQV